MRTLWKRIWITVASLVGLLLLCCLALLLVLYSTDINRYKTEIESVVSETTGRQFKIDGNLELILSRHPYLSIENASIANADWSEHPHMLSIEKLQLQITLNALLEQQLVIDTLTVEGLQLIAEKNSDGLANWIFKKEGNATKKENNPTESGKTKRLDLAPVIKKLQLSDIRVLYQDQSTDLETDLYIEALELSNHTVNQPFNFHTHGNINQHDFSLQGKTSFKDSNAALQPNNNKLDEALQINVNAKSAGTTLAVTGTIKQPILKNGIDINISLKVPDLEKSYKAVTNTSLQSIAINTNQPLPLDASLHLSNTNGFYQVSNMHVQLANSDIHGDISIKQKDKTSITAELQSNIIDINRLLTKKTTQTPVHTKKTETENIINRLSNTPLPFKLLNKFDLAINYNARKVILEELTPEELRLNTTLENGALLADKIYFKINNTPVEGKLSIQQKPEITINTELKTTDLNLLSISKLIKTPQLNKSKVSTSAKLNSHGNNLRAIISNLNGDARLSLTATEFTHISEDNSYDIKIDNIETIFNGMSKPLQISMEGLVNKQAISASGTIDNPLNIINNEDTNLDLTALALATELSIKSEIKHPEKITDADFYITLKSDDLSVTLDSARLITPTINKEIYIPGLPLNLSSNITVSTNNVTGTKTFLTLGKNDISGNFSIDLKNNKPLINAAINSQLLDLNTILPPDNKKNKIEEEDTGSSDNNTPLFSDKPLPSFRFLQEFDANISYRLKELISNKRNIKNIHADLKLSNGLLNLNPVSIDLINGTLRGSFEIDANKSPSLKTSITINKLNYGRLMSMSGIKEYASGELDADIQLDSSGASIHQLMETLNGKVRITAEDGNMNAQALRILSRDLTSLLPFTNTDERQKIRCAVADFDISNGIAKTHSLVLDTGTISALGTGEINLASETLSLYISPRTKRTSVMKLALVPMNVEGKIKDPSITPDAAGTTVRTTNTAAHIGLAVATGGLSLVAEDVTNKIWEQYIDNTDYCALALAGEKIVPTLAKFKTPENESENTSQLEENNDNEINNLDEDLDDDYGEF